MATGVTLKLWEMSNVVKVLEDWEASRDLGTLALATDPLPTFSAVHGSQNCGAACAGSPLSRSRRHRRPRRTAGSAAFVTVEPLLLDEGVLLGIGSVAGMIETDVNAAKDHIGGPLRNQVPPNQWFVVLSRSAPRSAELDPEPGFFYQVIDFIGAP
jgi:hypothetical protein